MKHELKTYPEYFGETLLGNKTFEIRYNDRGFNKGDLVVLQEYDPKECDLTGREIEARIIYMTNYEQQEGWVVLQLGQIEITE